GNAGLYGVAHGAGQGDTATEMLRKAGTVGALNAAGGSVAHGLFGELAPPTSKYLGNKMQDLAGWLKVNSIHPTQTLGEAMDSLPGGIPAVGRELLDRGIGGLTKSGTAKQLATEQ